MNPISDLVVRDPWRIIQRGFSNEHNRKYESLMSIGNGHMGQRATFEEDFSGSTHSGSYMGGIYFPDKTRVGWWKNGYPEYFAKVINSTNWIGISILLNDQPIDLATMKIESFERVLDMQTGLLHRNYTGTMPGGERITVKTERFCSMDDRELGVVQFALEIHEGEGRIQIKPYLDGDIMNEDSNYEVKFWEESAKKAGNNEAYLEIKTKKLDFHLGSAMKFSLVKNGEDLPFTGHMETAKKFIGVQVNKNFEPGDTFVVQKLVANCTSRDHNVNEIEDRCHDVIARAHSTGMSQLRQDHSAHWTKIWKDCDIVIEGDVEAQQAIRFNIFQLYQTYSGHDPRLNIGPKGFTGEKYGGSTYWDTEAYCLPFYMATTSQEVARTLLVYRYKHLGKAIENAEKLGFKNGAALYPMVTMNGEECHNEWEITFEEIHRNGAIAYAIYNYVRHTKDEVYLAEYGFEVLVGIARFWAQRVNWSEAKQQYVMLGVTGPNEYENNVNNNWYTNYLAAWCLKYTLEVAQTLQYKYANDFKTLCHKLGFNLAQSTEEWMHISENMHFPKLEGTEVYLQQEGYLDKENITVKDLPLTERPLNQKWSWDRILRSPFIKQADVLQGFYFFEDHFSAQALKDNFDYYEPRTVHESSLSPCIHSVLASKLGYAEKAYEMFLRTSRLDLDDYNREVHEGLHITSMAGTWIAMVQGFGGMRVEGDVLTLRPSLPKEWNGFQFSIVFRNVRVSVRTTQQGAEVHASAPIRMRIWDQAIDLKENETKTIARP
jgi:maltose phosphorylase